MIRSIEASLARGAVATLCAAFASLALALSLASGVARAQGPGQAAAKRERVFTLRIPGEPETLDWNRAHTMVETYVLMNLMEGLVTFDGGLKPVPSLAKGWTVSPDGRTYTFKLREGVKWSDGVPLKAKDFVYSWKRLLSPVTAASYAYFLFDIEGAELFNKGTLRDFDAVGIKAPDDGTLVVKLARPVAHWLSIPTFWVTFPLREDVVEKHGNSWASPGRMVTLGPYLLVTHDMDTRVVLKPNPLYWGSRGNLDQIVGLIVRDDSTALSLYEAGRIDFLTDIATLDLKRLEGRADLKTFPYLKVGYVGFVADKYPLSNARFRRAIAMAVDKSKFSQVLHGGQTPAMSFVPPGLLGHSSKVGLPFDPIRARSELRSSGVDLTAKKLTLEMIFPNWDKASTLAQFLQAELKKNLALEVVLKPFDNKTYRAQLALRAAPIFEASWSADYPDPDNFLSVFLSGSGNNWTSWKSESFDELVLNARNVRDTKVRTDLYTQAQKLLLEDQAVVMPLYYEPNRALVRGTVRGLELNPLNYLLLKKVNLP